MKHPEQGPRQSTGKRHSEHRQNIATRKAQAKQNRRGTAQQQRINKQTQSQKQTHGQKRRLSSMLGGVSLEHCHAPHATDTPRQPL